MQLFESIILLLVGAAVLSSLANRWTVPYPVFLAIAGIITALFFGESWIQFNPSPELILTLFVSPALLSAAHDISLRDLRTHWRPIGSLVIVAVLFTTMAVAGLVHFLIPGMAWAPSIAMGALLAPPDAVAAMAVLNQVNPPYKIRAILEGESLFNDASSLLIYKLAISAYLVGSIKFANAIQPILFVTVGSIAAGWVMAHLAKYQFKFSMDTPIAVIFQFALTFGVWMVAEHIGLSGVITIVVFGLTLSRYSTLNMPARLRVSSFSIWEAVIFILNALAFTLIGLQVRPIFSKLDASQIMHYMTVALIVLVVVIIVRLVWVMAYMKWGGNHKLPNANNESGAEVAKSGLVIAWSGMRGIVTLAAAMALPDHFPFRDFILLTAFIVVSGTLIMQGVTLGPLIKWLKLPEDHTIENEINLTRAHALKAAILTLEGDESAAAERLIAEYSAALSMTYNDKDPHGTKENLLKVQVVQSARKAIFDLLVHHQISDEAYRVVEEELDWLELSSTSR